MEQYATSFEVMLGSSEAALAKIAELKEFAAKTPFEMTDLANATKVMLGFGIESDKASEMLKVLGDISQGDSAKLSSLTLAFSQMTSTGKLMGQDLLQMINAGFNPLNEIAKQTGETMAEVKERMSAGGGFSRRSNRGVQVSNRRGWIVLWLDGQTEQDFQRSNVNAQR
jgi:tape measure domain